MHCNNIVTIYSSYTAATLAIANTEIIACSLYLSIDTSTRIIFLWAIIDYKEHAKKVSADVIIDIANCKPR